MKKLLYIIIAVAVLSSCTTKTVENGYNQKADFFTTKSDVGAYSNDGTTIIMLDETKYQVALSSDDYSFRVQTDNQSLYLECKVSVDPLTLSVGDETEMTVTSYGIQGLTSGTINVTLMKKENGKYWFMNAMGDKGYIFTCTE